MGKAAKTKSSHKRKTWQEKLHNGKTHKVEKTEVKFADIPAGSRMLVPTPLIVDAYIRNIPRGHFTGIRQIREDLAAEYHADYTCPVTTGIFIRIAAEAAYEEYKQGKSPARITPFWRVISASSPAAKKLSFGILFLKEQQRKEGIVT
ncbi:MAG: hypothetical protein ACO25B_07485 [Chitinophagaceae bacterium]